MTYLGNDTDYKRWAKEAGAGDCIVDPAWKGPGTVRLVLVDGNGQPANKELIDAVFNHIVSPTDRAARLLPTGCAELTCAGTPQPEEEAEARKILAEKYPDCEIVLTEKEDENLLGGYIIKVHHKEYDRSYEGRLRQLERKLTGR